MKKLFACLLVLSLLFALTACVNEQQPEDPPAPKLTTASRDTGNTTEQDDTTSSTEATTSTTSNAEITETQALRIAKQAIEAYSTYGMFSLCCDLEYVEGDFSQFLTEKQQEVYFQCQYKITCCQTHNQVVEHVRRHLASSLITTSAVNMLFTDDQGTLYLLVIPMGGYSLSDVRVLEYTDSRIIATANEYGHDTSGSFARYHFTLEKRGSNFVITKVAYTSPD